MVVNFSNNWQTHCGWLFLDRGLRGRMAKGAGWEKIAAFKRLKGSDHHLVNESTPHGRIVHHTLADWPSVAWAFKDRQVFVCWEISSRRTLFSSFSTSFLHFSGVQPPILRSLVPFLWRCLPQLLIPDHNERKCPLKGPSSPALDTMRS